MYHIRHTQCHKKKEIYSLCSPSGSWFPKDTNTQKLLVSDFSFPEISIQMQKCEHSTLYSGVDGELDLLSNYQETFTYCVLLIPLGQTQNRFHVVTGSRRLHHYQIIITLFSRSPVPVDLWTTNETTPQWDFWGGPTNETTPDRGFWGGPTNETTPQWGFGGGPKKPGPVRVGPVRSRWSHLWKFLTLVQSTQSEVVFFCRGVVIF